MVEKWKKQLINLQKSSKIDFHEIISDIKKRNFKDYDFKKLKWFSELYRIRIWKYRVIFKDIPWKEIELLKIDSRWDVYKWL